MQLDSPFKEDKLETGTYEPSDHDQEILQFVYDEYKEMRIVMVEQYPEFNKRTLNQFLDDNQKRANGYVPTRAEQGKEDWQANVFTPTTRNKVKALLAAIAKEPPPISVTAFNQKNQQSVVRAEIIKNLIEASYVIGEGNPETAIFFDGWDTSIDGTKIKYDGYLKVKNKVKFITDYDPTTGTISVEEKEVYTDDRCFEVDVPVPNLLIKNAYIRELQDQPALIWAEYYDDERFEYEFGQYKNAKWVKNGSEIISDGDTKLFFGNNWKERCEGKQREVLRYYNKIKDVYYIVANGVILLEAPLLWGKSKKRYPFAKTIFEPFANSKFFWGNSFVNILMAEQDVENALINSMADKTFRSLVTPMLIGVANKDAFDLEDEYVTGDTKIYVDSVDQVKPMPVPQVNQSEIAMLKIIQGGIDNDSTDKTQSGSVDAGATARGIIIANERAEELKGLFFIFMKDLWLQKTRLRATNILMNYSSAKVQAIAGVEGKQAFEETYKTFNIPRTKLSDGSQGGMSIEVVKDQAALARPAELDVREEMSRIEGRPIEIIQITSDFLDDYEYEIQIETDNIFQKSKALKMAMLDEKIKGVAALFPEIFLANKDEFFRMYMEGYGDNADKFLENMNSQPQPMPGMPPGAPGQPQQQPLPAGGVGAKLQAAVAPLGALKQ